MLRGTPVKDSGLVRNYFVIATQSCAAQQLSLGGQDGSCVEILQQRFYSFSKFYRGFIVEFYLHSCMYIT
jgi:hypothetical protein